MILVGDGGIRSSATSTTSTSRIPVEDVAGVAVGAGHRHLRAVAQHARRVAAADHRRNAELARDDRGVAGAAAPVRHDGRGALHHGLPVGVRHVGHEDVARLDPVHLGGRLDQAHDALTDALADGATARQHVGFRFQAVSAQVARALARFHGLRARLQDVELLVDAVPPPLDVHRAAVVLFDRHGEPRELVRLGVGDRESMPILVGDIDGDGRGARALAVAEHHAHGLRADGLAQDRRSLRDEVGLVEIELVRVHRALHDGLAQAVRSRDENDLIEARFRVQREHDARGPDVAADHALDAGGQGHGFVREALVDPIGDRPIVVEAGKYFTY